MRESDPFPLPPRLAELAQDLPHGLLRFKPAPGRARRDGWTAERQRAFIVRLALCGSVNAAAQAVGMTRRSAYKLLERPGGGELCRGLGDGARLRTAKPLGPCDRARPPR